MPKSLINITLEKEMAIGNAVERNGFVYVYDENNRQICCLNGGEFNPSDGLKGYTSSRVNIQRNGFIFSYDETGRQVGCIAI